MLAQLLQDTPSSWPHKGHGSLLLWLPWDPAVHTPPSHHIMKQPVPWDFHAQAIPSLSLSSGSLRYPLCIFRLSVLGRIFTNRKLSHFPGWKPNLCIRNACPYFQVSPFSAIPPLLSGNAQLRLSALWPHTIAYSVAVPASVKQKRICSTISLGRYCAQISSKTVL